MFSCRCETSDREIDRRVVSLKEKIEKSRKEKNDHPKYFGCSFFTDDFMLVGFEHGSRLA